jgi:hypothetical protein
VLSVPTPAHFDLVIHDRAGAQIRSLAAGDFPAGVHTFLWDGKTDLGAWAPNDLYVVNWSDTEGDSTFSGCLRLMLNDVDASNSNARFVAITNAAGVYSIPLSSLAVGQVVEGVDDVGNPVGFVHATAVVHVCAAASGDLGATTACVSDVQLGDLTSTVQVTVHLP